MPPEAPPTPATPPDGWYPDPAESGGLRWWEHGWWTTWVADADRSVHERPLPEMRSVPALATLPARAGLWGVVGAVAAIVVAGVAGTLVDSLLASLLVGSLSFYAMTTATVWFVSKRYGSGNLVRDIGLRFRWADLGAGLGAAIAGRAVGGAAVIVVLSLRQHSDDDPTPGQFDLYDPSDAAIIAALCVAVFAAPLFEEIFFRGFVQSTLETRFGPWWAIAVASVLFGAAHLSFDETTTANLVLWAATGLAGAVFGFAYWATRRLGTAIVGHALFNLVAAVVLIVDRFL